MEQRARASHPASGENIWWKSRSCDTAVHILLAPWSYQNIPSCHIMRVEMCSHAPLSCEQEPQTPAGLINPVACRPDVPPPRLPLPLHHSYLLINIHEQMGGPRRGCSWPQSDSTRNETRWMSIKRYSVNAELLFHIHQPSAC